MDIKIANISTANPKLKLSQDEALQFLLSSKNISQEEKILYKRFLRDGGINARYFALDKVEDIFIENQDIIIDRFQKKAVGLSMASLKKCFKHSTIKEEDIDCLITTTCTGYLCPGLTSYIVEKGRFRRDIYLNDIVGMGCGAALPALQGAYNFLKANNNSNALVLCTEICSSAASWGNDPELILSNSIFGDGAAACILTNKNGINGLRFKDFSSRILTEHRDELRFKIENSILRNVIKKTIPDIASSLIKEITDSILKKNHLKMKDITFWAIHPGGRRVLDRIQSVLGLNQEALSYSRRVLSLYGNMSSPTVLYILRDILEKGRLKRGDNIIMASFGAGFSGYAALLKYE